MFKQKAIVNAISVDELSEAREMINQCLLEKVDTRINDLKENLRPLETKDEEVEEETEYQKFFKSALKKFNVSSPADFKSDDEKKKFFDYVDKEYKGEKEED